MASQIKNSKTKRVKIKKEFKDEEKSPLKDLTHYKKDRVELMKQVFSIMLEKELLAMAPATFRGLGIETIRELLLDEVLGISSKRLQSILDGYKCPSDTESSDESSNEAIETISLDSISSDDDILLQQGSKQKKKHSKKKNTHDKDVTKKIQNDKDAMKNKGKVLKNEAIKDESKKSRKKNKDAKKPKVADEPETGMTVLELLELQARARAIRAQLAAVEMKNQNSAENDDSKHNSQSSESDTDEVVIKEEPPDIVEIDSSSDEVELKTTNNTSSTSKTNDDLLNNKSNGNNINNDAQPRKIKLKRNNLLVSVANSQSNKDCSSKNNTSNIVILKKSGPKSDENLSSNKTNNCNYENPEINEIIDCSNEVSQNSVIDDDDDDDDEIKLDLSDSEKMDVLEDLHSPESYSNINSTKQSSSFSSKLGKRNLSTNYNNLDVKTSSQNKKRHEKMRKVESVKNDNSNSDKTSNSTNKDSENHLTPIETITEKTAENIYSEMSEGECSNHSDAIEITSPNLDDAVVFINEELKSPETDSSNQTKIDGASEIPESNQCIITINDNNDEKKEESDLQLEKDPAFAENDQTFPQPENNTNCGDDFILEISDNSADDTTDAFSKEPTRAEIEELSQKIDTEIDRENFSIMETKSMDLKIKDNSDESQCDTEVSWKSRWLESGKVRKVLVTSQLCNAIRKKNKELKKQLEKTAKQNASNSESKQIEDSQASTSNVVENKDALADLTEGSVSQYEALPGSTKYVDTPVTTPPDEKAMVSDAKQLMKMYKKLIKINCSDEDSKKSQAKKHKKQKKKSKKEKKDKDKKGEKSEGEPTIEPPTAP